jgi:hypothetical protein
MQKGRGCLQLGSISSFFFWPLSVHKKSAIEKLQASESSLVVNHLKLAVAVVV